MPEKNINQAGQIAQSEGGSAQAPAEAQRSQSSAPDKMENELEMAKENKQELNSAQDVVGRGEKGTGTKILEKITPDPKEKGKDEPEEGGLGMPGKNM